MSLFLNNSSLLPPPSPGDSNCRRSSISEQSAFIEELALKYLNKATTKFETLYRCSDQSNALSSHATNTSHNVSIGTKEYLRRHNLNANLVDSDIPNGIYFSSIRLPDGNSLPRSKHLIASTPTQHGQPVHRDTCFKKPQNVYQDDSDWSNVKILEGLRQQPSILPARNEDSTDYFLSDKHGQYHQCDSRGSVYREDMVNVLDIDKLRQLPKYL